MKTIPLNHPLHNFTKVNLVTVTKSIPHDVYRCTKCGVEGKRYGFRETIEVAEKYGKKITNCDGCAQSLEDPYLYDLIQITQCMSSGPQFANLKPGSIHTICPSPPNYFNGDRGVWVMGVGEPVKILFEEFTVITLKRTTCSK